MFLSCTPHIRFQYIYIVIYIYETFVIFATISKFCYFIIYKEYLNKSVFEFGF